MSTTRSLIPLKCRPSGKTVSRYKAWKISRERGWPLFLYDPKGRLEGLNVPGSEVWSARAMRVKKPFNKHSLFSLCAALTCLGASSGILFLLVAYFQPREIEMVSGVSNGVTFTFSALALVVGTWIWIQELRYSLWTWRVYVMRFDGLAIWNKGHVYGIAATDEIMHLWDQ